jgi:excinuclease ABC subunit C
MSAFVVEKKLKSLPNSPGVYIFYDKTRKILYVGKSTSLKDRVGSYFQGHSGYARPIEISIDQVVDIEIKKTETVLEAYILEQELIKKWQPKLNVNGKDDKSFAYVVFTKEEFPRVIFMRKRELEQDKNIKIKTKTGKIYGPYISKKNIEIALKILRKIFPYHSRLEKTEKGCLDFQIGLCSGPYAGEITKEDYAKNIRGIQMILEGKKKRLIAKMKKEMSVHSKKQEFEKAGKMRNAIFALQHIQDVALISDSRDAISRVSTGEIMRIEGYDISNISGKASVGSMVVFDSSGGEMLPNKNEYREFKIKTIRGANDVGMMREVLLRRFQNNWTKPNLILLDGGAGHLNIARQALRKYKLEIPILAVAKGSTRKKIDLRSFGSVPKISQDLIQKVRDEAHRFAIAYHKKLRKKIFME